MCKFKYFKAIMVYSWRHNREVEDMKAPSDPIHVCYY